MAQALIGVDLCNTIADINSQIERCFQVKAATYPVYGIPHKYFSSPGGLAMFRNAMPFAYAASVLWNIARAGCKIIYMTTRPQKAGPVTVKWLMAHGFPNGRIVFTARKNKTNFVVQSDMPCVFEDDPLVLNKLLHTGVKYIFVKEWPYNLGLTDEKIIKFHSWRELLDWPFNQTDIKPLFGLSGHQVNSLAAAKGD